MALFKRSSCEDSVDQFNHTLLVIILLILSVVMFFIPFGLHTNGRPGEHPDVSWKYSSNCWCPPEFTNNMVDYANAACKTAYVRYRSMSPPIESDQSYATVSRIPGSNYQLQVELELIEMLAVQNTGVYLFILEHTPLFLFVSAVVFKFVHVLFLLFVSWYGVNFGSLIETWRSVFTETELGEQPKKAFLQDLSRKMKTSLWLSLGYLFYKLTICILSVIVGMVIYYSMIPGLDLLDASHQLSDDNISVQPQSITNEGMCKLIVLLKEKKNVHNLHCLFTATLYSDDHSQMLRFYKPIFTALLFAFVIISLVSGINWTLWSSKLCRRSKLSMDARLLVCFVAEHGDFIAAEKLEEGLIDIQKDPVPKVELIQETEEL